MQSILPLAAAFLIALLITPWVTNKAFCWGAVDVPNKRKVHCRKTPRLGGVSIYLAFIPVVLLALPLKPGIIGLVIGATLVFTVGLLDDFKDISPRLKLGGQVLAALAVIPFGIRVDFITSPFDGGMIYLGLWGIPITVFWLVAVTNAVNLIDGLDGLAGGVSCIAALTMAVVAWTQFRFLGIPGQAEIIVMALVLAAALAGFLKHNFHPASIFLGDSGSMLLGFVLGVISVMGLTKSTTAISVMIPLVVMGIPLLDTTFAICRRFQENKPIFQPDREHIHHQLLAMGLTQRQAVLVIYGISIILGTSAVLLNILTANQAMLLLLVLATVSIVVAGRLRVASFRTRRVSDNAGKVNNL